MTRIGGTVGFGVVAACAALVAAPAQAAKSCAEPGASWERATPAEAGMDAVKLQAALDYGSTQASYAVRIYRHGCLVGEDRAVALNRNSKYESFSMAKSVTSMVFGRALTLGLISPDDPVGSLVTQADAAHGEITARDLLTMTSGLRWNGYRDYNVFTMPDRIQDALTLDLVRKPGTYFEYAQSAVSLLAEAVGRAAGEDVEAFAQRELMDPLGIPAGSWYWVRDKVGHVLGFSGVNMRPDDFGRLGELMRRGGVWKGRRLLSRRYVTESVTPTPTNGCYGWLIWVNAGAPCVGPTVSERPVEPGRDFPDLPADMYEFAGLFGQRVTVFPTQGIVLVRTGQDPNLLFSFDEGWEHGLYRRVLAAVADQRIVPPGEPPKSGYTGPEADYGFHTALSEPDQYSKGFVQDPLPPAGPPRARAAQLRLAESRLGRTGIVTLGLACPPRWPLADLQRCAGSATLTGALRPVRYDVRAGGTRLLRFRLGRRELAAARRRASTSLQAAAVNGDAAQGTATRLAVTVLRPR